MSNSEFGVARGVLAESKVFVFIGTGIVEPVARGRESLKKHGHGLAIKLNYINCLYR